MFVDLPKEIIEAKEKGYINSRLEVIVESPPQWVLDELNKFFKDYEEMYWPQKVGQINLTY